MLPVMLSTVKFFQVHIKFDILKNCYASIISICISTIIIAIDNQAPELVSSQNADLWSGFNMTSFSPANIVTGRRSWLYMPVIYGALWMWNSKWLFPLPSCWDEWISTYQQAFFSDHELNVFHYISHNLIGPDHLSDLSQQYHLFERYSTNEAVRSVSQQILNWAIQQEIYE